MNGLKTATMTDKNFTKRTPGSKPGDPPAINPDAIGSIKEDIKMLYDTIMNGVFPVGSVYTNVTDARNPAVILGFGTWAALTGMVLAGYTPGDAYFGTPGAVVGEKTHALSISELPSHAHDLKVYQCASGSGEWAASAFGTATGGFVVGNGSNVAHNNVQPTKVVYMWQRTA